MKTRKAVCSVGSIIAIVLFYFVLWQPSQRHRKNSAISSKRSLTETPETGPQAAIASPSQTDLTKFNRESADKPRWDFWLATPISFFGRVIDEQGRPVPRANVEISFTDHVWEGNTNLTQIADDDGSFHVSGHGLGIGVGVSKSGYQRTEHSDRVFAYSKATGETNVHTQAADPAIFILRKMADAAPLFTFEHDFPIIPDGRPFRIGLTQAQIGPHAGETVHVQVWSDRSVAGSNSGKKRYAWRSLISVENGGLTRRSDELTFEAPAGGYSQSDEMDMPPGINGWRSQLSRQDFVQFASGTYARVQLTISTGSQNPFVTVKSYLNPTPGDRNLEFDPAKQIKVP